MAASCVFLVKSSFETRVGIFTYSNLIGLFPLIALRPYKDWKMNVIELIQELSFFTVCLLILSTSGGEYAWRETTIYWVMIISGIMTFIMIVVHVIFSVLAIIKALKEKNYEIKKIEKSDEESGKSEKHEMSSSVNPSRSINLEPSDDSSVLNTESGKPGSFQSESDSEDQKEESSESGQYLNS